MIKILTLLFIVNGYASMVEDVEPKVLFDISNSNRVSRELNSKSKKKVIIDKKNQSKPLKTNLPKYYRNTYSSNEYNTLTPDEKIKSVDLNLSLGDELPAIINHSIIAFPNEKAPVIAQIYKGQFKGATLIGESIFEDNSKRILVEFKYLKVSDKKIYRINGKTLNSQKQYGIYGEHVTNELKYFSGDLISSMVAAYFDSRVPTNYNLLGQEIKDTSVDSAFKKGLSSGAMASAERFREKLKNASEFIEAKGPIEINVLVTDLVKNL